ncbi:MAG: ParB N-terminal domain-containing protein [Rubrobacteraceae bacterium]
MISSLNDLRIVPLERLILHEAHDPDRLDRLRGRMEAEGVQRNPVIVAPHGEDYLVLDGAHRFQTLKELGCDLILVQTTEPPDIAESWGHIVDEGLLPGFRGVGEVETSYGDSWLARVTSSGSEEVLLEARGEGLAAEVEALWGLRRVYPEGVVRRVDSEAPVELEAGEAMIRYRPFTPRELVEVVRLGKVLPAGITRFRVRERVLGVRFPLEKLRDGVPEKRNEELKNFVRKFWRENRIRYYGEPVVLFE